MIHKLVGKVYSGSDILWRSKDIVEDLVVGFCETCGFHHAYPYPGSGFLAEYYDGYEMPIPLHPEEQERIGRMIASKLNTSDSIIDIGCGKGEILDVLVKQGFTNLFGSEYGSMGKDARRRNPEITILLYDIAGLCNWCKQESKTFDGVILVNVLEHVPEPIILLNELKGMLSPQGLLMFCVPNDFSLLQMVHLKNTGVRPWFITLPDHINYFSLQKIDGIMARAGYEVVYKTAQYPLEVFLLQGDDYVARPETGKLCHNKRKTFEKAFLDAGREKEKEDLYEGFAKLGIGRNMYVFAKSV